MDEYFWLLKRITNFIIWQIPIMYIIWPKSKKVPQLIIKDKSDGSLPEEAGFGYGSFTGIRSPSFRSSSVNNSAVDEEE